MLTHLNMVMPYWESPEMLREQVLFWLRWPPQARKRTTFVIVDDCSKNYPIDAAFLKKQPLDIRAFRIKRKEAWNWRAAKNIGMHEADEGWSLITDIDHVLPGSQAKLLFLSDLRESFAYHFKRRNASNGKPYKVHSSTWLLTKKMFKRIGGYDESFVGTQMGWLGEYPGRVQKNVEAIRTLPIHVLRYDRNVIPDSTANLPRRFDSEETESAELARVEEIKATWTGVKTMTFPYERVV